MTKTLPFRIITQRMILAVVVLLVSGFAPPFLSAQQQARRDRNINLSVNISTHSDSLKTSVVNLGLLSSIQQLQGVGLNLISNKIHKDMYGLQLSGFLNQNYGNAYGLQFASLGNVVHQNANGMMVSGILNHSNGESNGIMLSGMSNVTGKRFNGIVIGGVSNIATGEVNGAQISSLMNTESGKTQGAQIALLSNVGSDIHGVQASVISNIATKSITGLQVGGATNIAVNADKAFQLTSIANICLDNLNGIQLAAGNYAENVKGAQLGLFNVSSGKQRGWQIGIFNYSRDTTNHKIGLINVNPKTRIQAMIYAGNVCKINLAVRFKNRRFYNILGVGSHYLDLNKKYSGALFYRAGIYFPLKRKFEISGDLGYYHIENFENASLDIPERMYAIQGRVNLEYKLLRKLGLFISTGYSMTRYYQKSRLFENEAIIEGGIVIF